MKLTSRNLSLKKLNRINESRPTLWASFYLLPFYLYLLLFEAQAGDIFVIARFETYITNFKNDQFINAFQNQLKKDLSLQKKIVVHHPDESLKLQKNLKKGDLVINLIFGFEDTLYAYKKSGAGCSNLANQGQVDYGKLLHPYFQELKKTQQLVEKKRARVESIWLGGILKRKLVLEKILSCDLSTMKLGSEESYSRLLDTVSLNNYPVTMSNILNLDKRFPRQEGSKIDSVEIYTVLAEGIVALTVPELTK